MSAAGWYYVSTDRMTGAVRVERDVIVEAPPVMRRFIGQHPLRLGAWLRKQGGFKVERLSASGLSR